jgi:predicted NodU family carbamoyl transferase
VNILGLNLGYNCLSISLNIEDQPIVNDLRDVILCFLKYNIDYLAIGDYIVEKR